MKLILLSLMSLSFSLLANIEIGKPAPDFELKGLDGATYKLSDFKGKTVVLEWFNDGCPFVRKHYDKKFTKNFINGNIYDRIIYSVFLWTNG